jgi:hypothetical protein
MDGIKNVAVLDPILNGGASDWGSVSLTDSTERPTRLKELAGTAVALVLGGQRKKDCLLGGGQSFISCWTSRGSHNVQYSTLRTNLNEKLKRIWTERIKIVH